MQRAKARALEVGGPAVHADGGLVHSHIVRGRTEIEGRGKGAAVGKRLVGRVQGVAVGQRGGGRTVLHPRVPHGRGVNGPAEVLRRHRGGVIVCGMVGGGRVREVPERRLLLFDGVVVVAGWKRASRGEIDGFLRLVGVLLRSLHPLASLEVAVLKHLLARLVQGPVVALAISALFGYLHEALVEGEVVADGVLPSLLVLCIVRELVHDELVNPTQRELLVGRLGDCHGNERNVRVGGLDVFAAVVVGVDGRKERPVLLFSRSPRAVGLRGARSWGAGVVHCKNLSEIEMITSCVYCCLKTRAIYIGRTRSHPCARAPPTQLQRCRGGGGGGG